MMKDGGPAYPVTEMQAVHAYAVAEAQEAEDAGLDRERAYVEARGAACAGMSLRDHFAGLAMQGICAHQDNWGKNSITGIAKVSYEIADAMLKARSEVQP